MAQSGNIDNERRRPGSANRQNFPKPAEQTDFAFYDWLEIFYRRKWTIILPFIIISGVAAIVAFTLPPYYRSTTLILVERQQVPEIYVKPTDTTSVAQRLNTIKQQILSRTKLEQIIKNFNLFQSNTFRNPNSFLTRLFSVLPEKWRLSPEQKTFMEDKVELMRESIEVEVIGTGNRRTEGVDAFTVSYIGRDPQITMEVTNAVASLFIEENLKLREQYAEGTSEFIGNELEKARVELEEQENALRTFKEKNIGGLPEQLDANLRTLDRLQLELQSVRIALKGMEDNKIVLGERLGISPIVSGNNALQIELEELKAELSSLLSMYKENYPDVMLARNRIKETEKTLAQAKDFDNKAKEAEKKKIGVQNVNVDPDLMSAISQIKTLQKQENYIQKQIGRYQKRVEDTPANEQKLSALLRNYEMSMKNYQSLLEKKLNARLAENLEKRQKGERFRVIDPANFPEKPFKPDRLKIILFGAMFGGGVGAGLVYLLEFMNPAFRRPEDFEDVLPQPVLAAVPLFSIAAGRNNRGRRKVLEGKKIKK